MLVRALLALAPRRLRLATDDHSTSNAGQLRGKEMRNVLLFLSLVLAGCSTPYQEMGLAGGVHAQQITANTFRIVARGNSSTAHTTIQDYTLLKTAETTRQAGGTHFVIISAADASSIGEITTPGQNTYIRIFTVSGGQVPPPGARVAFLNRMPGPS
jgi:hypothetical protein